jgi:hypothetical protein
MAEQQNNLAVLVVDVIDSRRPHESLGDAASFPEAQECIEIVLQVAASCAGHVIKTIIDGVMCAFSDADSAVRAACEIQDLVQKKESALAHKISIRIGLHFGQSLIAGAVAQRMAVLATSGQIITTGETNALLSAEWSSALRPQTLPARKKDETITVYEVMWYTGGNQSRMPEPLPAITQHTGVSRLRLTHAGREIQVIMTVNIGRRSSHNIELKDPRVSRDHAFIVRRVDQFVLVDQSRNGTFVRMDNGKEYKIKNEEMVLLGNGVVTFGRRAHEKGAEIVSFWCESNDATELPSS